MLSYPSVYLGTSAGDSKNFNFEVLTILKQYNGRLLESVLHFGAASTAGRRSCQAGLSSQPVCHKIIAPKARTEDVWTHYWPVCSCRVRGSTAVGVCEGRMLAWGLRTFAGGLPVMLAEDPRHGGKKVCRPSMCFTTWTLHTAGDTH